ncbi:glycine cleavage system protein H [bacterium]|nr:glycine cleavage system protein H [bacterium]|tara:strand:- start:128 stop:514 length:387 start_codon:yes stop_codon:yes gene_type:complete
MQEDLLKYSEDHEWIFLENSIATIGVSQYALDELGEIVFIELPEKDSDVTQKSEFGTIESVKTVSSIYAPVSGKIIDVNTTLADQPELINSDPYNNGWLIKVEISDLSELDSLLSFEEYQLFLKTLVH